MPVNGHDRADIEEVPVSRAYVRLRRGAATAPKHARSARALPHFTGGLRRVQRTRQGMHDDPPLHYRAAVHGWQQARQRTHAVVRLLRFSG